MGWSRPATLIISTSSASMVPTRDPHTDCVGIALFAVRHDRICGRRRHSEVASMTVFLKRLTHPCGAVPSVRMSRPARRGGLTGQRGRGARRICSPGEERHTSRRPNRYATPSHCLTVGEIAMRVCLPHRSRGVPALHRCAENSDPGQEGNRLDAAIARTLINREPVVNVTVCP